MAITLPYPGMEFVPLDVLTAQEQNQLVANIEYTAEHILDATYPVGSIYMSTTLTTATAVHNALGGTWQAWGAGRVPVGIDTTQTEFNTVEKTGGAKEVTLTTDQMPKHRHTNLYTAENALIGTGGSSSSVATGHISNGSYNLGSVRTGDAGGDEAHNNLQPYITCYMYKRTA